MAPKRVGILETPEEQRANAGILPALSALEDAIQPGGRTYSADEVFSDVARTPGGQPIKATFGYIDATKNERAMAGRPTDQQYNNLKQAVVSRLEATGVTPCTILNFLPIPLVLNSPMQSLKVRIPPAPKKADQSDDFSFHTWTHADIVVLERGEGVKHPWEYLPIQLGKSFMDEYRDFGGVVLLRGLPDARTLALKENVEAIEAAKQKMVAWMLSKVEEANGQWNTPSHSGSRNIVELHRQCAYHLRDLNVIDSLPDWVIDAKDLKDTVKKCPICQSTPNVGAVECLACHYVLDPARAFTSGAITEEDGSLERLTREEVESLGISAYVAETIDERPARLKKGLPKPASLAAANALAAQQRAAAGVAGESPL